jgi:regulator of sigma D
MLQKFKRIQEEWGGSSDVIDHWLDTRQVLLVDFCKLAACQPLPSANVNKNELPSPTEIENFCLKLIEYISTGHFKIYDMVKDQWQKTGFTTTEEIDQHYFSIVATTEPLLEFADKYVDIDEEDFLEDFDDDLSWVGEILETRFEREDKLIRLIADSLAFPPGA